MIEPTIITAATATLKTAKGIQDFGKGAVASKAYLVYQDAKPSFWVISVQREGKFVGALTVGLERGSPFSSAVSPQPQDTFWLKDEDAATIEFRSLHPSAQINDVKLVLTRVGYAWTVRGSEGGNVVEESIYTRYR